MTRNEKQYRPRLTYRQLIMIQSALQFYLDRGRFHGPRESYTEFDRLLETIQRVTEREQPDSPV